MALTHRLWNTLMTHSSVKTCHFMSKHVFPHHLTFIPTTAHFPLRHALLLGDWALDISCSLTIKRTRRVFILLRHLFAVLILIRRVFPLLFIFLLCKLWFFQKDTNMFSISYLFHRPFLINIVQLVQFFQFNNLWFSINFPFANNPK